MTRKQRKKIDHSQNSERKSDEEPNSPKRKNRRKQRTTPTPDITTNKRQNNQRTPDKQEAEPDLCGNDNHPQRNLFYSPDTQSSDATNDTDTDDEQKLPGKKKLGTNQSMEEEEHKEDESFMDGSDDDTAAFDNTHIDENAEDDGWKTVAKKAANPYNRKHLAKDLPIPKNRGFKYLWRGNFCLTIEPAASKEEIEENVNEAVQELVKIMVRAGAQLLPWKEEDYAMQEVVSKTNLDQFLNKTYEKKRKLYINSGWFKTNTRKVYVYMYWGLPRRYEKFRTTVESQLKEKDIVWYKKTLQGEKRYELGFVRGSHRGADLRRIEERIKANTNLDVVARWRMWTLPPNLRPSGSEDDRVYAIALETHQQYTPQERRLVYRTFGNDPEIRKIVDPALETTLEIQLVPAKMNGMLDEAKNQATMQRAIQRGNQ
jgi:hypothetical protein